jgi:hypothetical protein
MPTAKSALEMPTPFPMFVREMSAEVVDERDYFAKISKATPRDTKAEEAFIASKFHILLTHPTLNPAKRKFALAELTKRFGRAPLSALANEESPPVPGGSGYGSIYNSAFKVAFVKGTSLSFDVVCPTRPGGNVSDFLYLTAMNRASKGVEAFVSYFAQTDFHFKVFDWARTEGQQFVLDIPFENLGSYLTTLSSHGSSYQIMSVINTTFRTSVLQWKNEVYLWNVTAGRWDLMYGNPYDASDAQQAEGFVGSWGPIVETFEPVYRNTNQMGFLNTGLISQDFSGAWGSWSFLSAADSFITTDNVGFTPLFLDPNYQFVVKS